MLKEDSIELSKSPWTSPVIMIPKKDGSNRVCIDYRKLNAKTIPDRYPLPRIDDLIHYAKSSRLMSTIDLCSDYWQVEVYEQDRVKPAIITPFGMYQFKKMLFGLRNAPAMFQRMIDRLKFSLPNIAVYLDDIIIISDTFEQNMSDQNSVFSQFNKYNLRANMEKCHFFCTEVKCFGHILTQNGILPDPEKMEAIKNRKTPRNLKQVFPFTQACSLFMRYRRFIEDFANIMQTLTKMTSKNAIWQWETAQQKAFDTLRKLLHPFLNK